MINQSRRPANNQEPRVSDAMADATTAVHVHLATKANPSALRRYSFGFTVTQLPVPPPPPSPAPTGNPAAVDCFYYYSVEDFPNKSLFDVTISHSAVSVPVQKTGSIRTLLKTVLAKGVKNTHMDAAEEDRRILVLKPGTTQAQIAELVTAATAATNTATNTDLLRWIPEFPITRTYQDQSGDELLRKLLPAEYEIPSSFELVGPIAHVNLKESYLPYKYWIGQILLERNPAVKIVVNKVGTIDTVYRTFDMEVLAGDATDENWSVVTVHEHGNAFQLDYRHVYWNSRLSGEHTRLVDLILKEQRAEPKRSLVVADLMAGVGPFAIPLTRQQRQPRGGKAKTTNKNCPTPPVIVHANDLNPVSFQYLQLNAQTNKCRNLHCYNQDARAFVHWLQQQQQQQQSDSCIERIDHVIMNLPASAPEFLDAFRGWSLGFPSSSSSSSSGSLFLPTVHVHCFAPKVTHTAAAAARGNDDDSYYATAVQRCERALGCPLEPDTVRIHIVRNVSPSNNMLCISFPLPRAVTLLERITLGADDCTTTTTTTKTTIAIMAETDISTTLSDQPNAKRTKVQ